MAQECTLYGIFGWCVQLLLVASCFSALVVKRYREVPQRPWSIFLLDVSKQGLSAALAHTMNMLIATLLEKLESENQCVWYFVNITIDTSLGVILCYLLVRVFEGVAVKNGWERLRTGQYMTHGRTSLDFGGWAIQVAIWAGILTSVKWVLFVVIYLNADYLSVYGSTLISWMDSYPQVELVVVMIFVPLTMNCIQFWVQDTFLKARAEEREALSQVEMNSVKPM